MLGMLIMVLFTAPSKDRVALNVGMSANGGRWGWD